jgi:hypothetical protein
MSIFKIKVLGHGSYFREALWLTQPGDCIGSGKAIPYGYALHRRKATHGSDFVGLFTRSLVSAFPELIFIALLKVWHS